MPCRRRGDDDANVRFRSGPLTRRRLLAELGAAIVALSASPTACAGDDRDRLTSTPDPTSADRPDDTTATAPASTVDTEPTIAATTAAALTPFPAGAEAVITFSFAATGEQIRNPYVAVWIEDGAGALVATVAVWFNASTEAVYLQALRRWYQVSGTHPDQTEIARSSATRLPGQYAVVWDGAGRDGQPVAGGTYHLCIEAVREGGPYQLIREPIVIGAGARTVALPDNGELQQAAVSIPG